MHAVGVRIRAIGDIGRRDRALNEPGKTRAKLPIESRRQSKSILIARRHFVLARGRDGRDVQRGTPTADGEPGSDLGDEIILVDLALLGNIDQDRIARNGIDKHPTSTGIQDEEELVIQLFGTTIGNVT